MSESNPDAKFTLRPNKGILREGYKNSTKVWKVDGPPGSNAKQREHWDGRLDAKVSPEPLKVRFRMEQ